jgi:acyl carrier protein
MASREEIAVTITNVIQEALVQKGVSTACLTIDRNIDQSLSLESLGLDSLDWAAIVVMLEEKTQVDPFQRGPCQELHTLGDLVDVYVSETNLAIVRDREVK